MPTAVTPSHHTPSPPSRRAVGVKRVERKSPPFLLRILPSLLALLASVLLVTTVYLFHLHHSRHDLEHDDYDALSPQSDFDLLSSPLQGPGGSALRHKMDLAQFLMRRHDEAEAERSRNEAMDRLGVSAGGWRGGSEEDFVKLVKSEEQEEEGGGKSAIQGVPTVPPPVRVEATPVEVKEVAVVVDAGKGGDKGHIVDDANDEKRGDDEKKDDAKVAVTVDKDRFADTLPKLTWRELQRALVDERLLPPPIPRERTARGFSGLPPEETPALVGSRRGTITCPDTDQAVQDVMSSMLAFWNEPRGDRDESAGGEEPHVFIPPPLDLGHWKSPKLHRRRYLTFEPDTGGFNNIRMSLENVVTLAAATGRTLVLPPDQVVYLLHAKKGKRRERNYYDLLNVTDNVGLLRRVPVITSAEFMKLEGNDDGFMPVTHYNATWREHLNSITEKCEERKKSDVFCEDLYDHYRDHGGKLANFSSEPPNEDCLIFDVGVFEHGPEYVSKLPADITARVKKFCGKRRHVYYDREMHDAPIWHFETLDIRYRLLVHTYAFIFFTDPEVGNYYKRMIRDFLRYHDEVFCAAGKIILALQYEDHVRRNKAALGIEGEESKPSPLRLDSELIGGYSSLHIRRGDLQFKEVKFDSLQWYQNTRELWKGGEVLYVATDESESDFFDDFRSRHDGPLRFFGDYTELAGLDDIDPTLYGMIDTVVASRGSVFCGTWFSTFSGYIIRLRGYYGVSKFYSYYSWLERKFFMHRWMDVSEGSYYAREYPVGWTSIDGDAFVDTDNEKARDRDKPYPRDEMDRDKAIATANVISKRYNGGTANAAVREDASNNHDSAEGVGINAVAKSDTPNNLARGIAGRPMESTPALIGAKRGHITCDTDVDSLAYWNEPQGDRDSSFVSPFSSPTSKPKYLVFTPDKGGFNNVRMSFEIILLICVAFDRILVLPPEQPMYLLRNDVSKKHRGLNEFFELEGSYVRQRLKYMTMEEFLLKEGRPGGQFPIPEGKTVDILAASRVCSPRRTVMKWSSDGLLSCDVIHDYLAQHATQPNITATHHQCLIFDKGMYERGVPDDQRKASEFCSSGNRKLVYATKKMNEPQLLYIQGGKPPTRMLAHYYGYLLFTDPAVDNYFKRYIRDLIRLRYEIFCAAGKIIRHLQDAGRELGFSTDSEGAGGYSSLHVRRGDFQYTKMLVTDEEWYTNTKEIWHDKEVLYIATDDKDFSSNFQPFRNAGHKLYFLSDFTELAGLKDLDPNWFGMIDVVVASRGRAFAGSFRSTFSGYINRLRGYYGLSMKDSWFGQAEKKEMMHEFHNVNLDTYAKEWPDAWLGIDADVAPSQDIF